MSSNLEYWRTAQAFQGPLRVFSPINTPAAAGPESVPCIVAGATAFLSAATADWLAEQIGPDEIDVRAAPGRLLRVSLAANSVSFALIEADTSRLFDPAPRFPAGIVRRAMSVPWHGPRRRLVSALRKLGRDAIAFSLSDRTELQISFGPNWLHVAIVRELAEGDGLFVGEPRRMAGKEKGPAGNRAFRGDWIGSSLRENRDNHDRPE